MKLAAILDRLLAYAVRTQPAIQARLQPGYDPDTIARIVPFPLPAEILELYAWHNGTPDEQETYDVDLFYYHRLLPLEEAYDTYQGLMQVNHDIGLEGFNPNLFPIFTYDREYYSVWFGPPAEHAGAIYFVFQGEGQVYDNLTSMLSAILECYDTGAYRIVEGKITVDEPRVAAIKARWNRCRIRSDGTTLNYHP